MSILTEIFSGGAGKLVSEVGQVLDNVITTKEEKSQLDNEMRKAELQYNLDMAKLSTEEKQMVLSDVASARTMGTAIQTSENATKLSKNITPYLALGTTLLVLTLFFVLVFRADLVPEKSKDLIMYILGVLSTVLVQIYSYYFGSSSGSAAKDRTISGMKGPE